MISALPSAYEHGDVLALYCTDRYLLQLVLLKEHAKLFPSPHSCQTGSKWCMNCHPEHHFLNAHRSRLERLDRTDQLGAAMVYEVRGLCTIVRCPSCDNALIRLAHYRERYLVDVRGASYLTIR